MQQPVNFPKAAPTPMRRSANLDATIRRSGLEQAAHRTGEDARLADQRLRLLPRHALQGRAQARRDRAAALSAERVAGDAVLLRPRARRPGLDRVPDPAGDRRRARRGYQALKASFTPAEIANLTALIGVINVWNRIAVGLNLPLPQIAEPSESMTKLCAMPKPTPRSPPVFR